MYVYDAFNAATDGTASSGPFCLATDGFLCPPKRPIAVSLPPAEGLREKRDMKDLRDILRLLEEVIF